MIDDGIEINSKQCGEYSLDLHPDHWGDGDEFLITRKSDGEMILYAELKSKRALSFLDDTALSGIEAFDLIARETETMRRILSDILEEVRKKESGFIMIDSTSYDGTGVELAAQFGYMTGGMKVNLSSMSTKTSNVMIFSDVDCNVTLCCIMTYWRKDEKDERLVRIGSGKGVDEAIFNAKNRIANLIEGMNLIDEYLFNRLCIGEP